MAVHTSFTVCIENTVGGLNSGLRLLAKSDIVCFNSAEIAAECLMFSFNLTLTDRRSRRIGRPCRGRDYPDCFATLGKLQRGCGTLIFSIHTLARVIFFGFKILNFNIFLGFQKNE